jgi:hypothetical protein
MTNISILKLSGAFHWVKTSRMRFWAFSYSIGDPCERSFQLITYFIGMLLCLSEIGGGLLVNSGRFATELQIRGWGYDQNASHT